jgi:hypothetical protein
VLFFSYGGGLFETYLSHSIIILNDEINVDNANAAWYHRFPVGGCKKIVTSAVRVMAIQANIDVQESLHLFVTFFVTRGFPS